MAFDVSSIRSALPDISTVQQLERQHSKPQKVDIKKHIRNAIHWQVHSASDREVTLVSSVDGALCKIDFSEKKPKAALLSPEKGIKPIQSTSSLPKITEFALSNGHLHEEDEPFQACEHAQRFVVKKVNELVVYEITSEGINQLMTRDAIGRSELLGCFAKYLIISKATTDRKIELQAYSNMVIDGTNAIPEKYTTNSLDLTRLSDEMIVIVDDKELKAYSVSSFFQKIFSHKFSKHVVSYAFNDSRIACLCENGKLYTWNLKQL